MYRLHIHINRIDVMTQWALPWACVIGTKHDGFPGISCKTRPAGHRFEVSTGPRRATQLDETFVNLAILFGPPKAALLTIFGTSVGGRKL
jgi:hypothetical protein